jgi:hypothetical protein
LQLLLLLLHLHMGSPSRTHALDIFDELEIISHTHEYLSSLTTAMVLSEIRDEKEDDEDYHRDRDIERNDVESEEALYSDATKSCGGAVDGVASFVSIYDLLPDSYKAPFFPDHLHLLSMLKKIPLTKSGQNKRTHSFETFQIGLGHSLECPSLV